MGGQEQAGGQNEEDAIQRLLVSFHRRGVQNRRELRSYSIKKCDSSHILINGCLSPTCQSDGRRAYEMFEIRPLSRLVRRASAMFWKIPLSSCSRSRALESGKIQHGRPNAWWAQRTDGPVGCVTQRRPEQRFLRLCLLYRP